LLVFYIFEKIFLESSFSIKNLILEMIDYDFSIQDFVEACKGVRCNLDFL